MRTIALLLLTTLSVFFCDLCHAQRRNAVPKEIQQAFTAKIDSSEYQNILYREAVIHPELSDSAMLVIFLHSAGGRGDDNLSHLGMPAVKDIYNYLESHNLHAYFIAPQCPKTASWNGVAPGGDRPRGAGPGLRRAPFEKSQETLKDETPYVRYLMPFIKNYVARHPISHSKIYILGASMGAAGVWEIIAGNPDFFTAAMPASGAYRGTNLTPLKQTPIVCTTGTKESSCKKNKKVIQQLSNAGADATFIPLNGLSHIEACNKAFTEENLNLLFSKHRLNN